MGGVTGEFSFVLKEGEGGGCEELYSNVLGGWWFLAVVAVKILPSERLREAKSMCEETELLFV